VLARPDVADKVVHFTSGATHEEAYGRLRSIVSDCQLNASGDKIRGNHLCICFSEAPLNSLQHGLVNPSAYSRYSPFGVIFEKRWLFEKGGRPVIYQSDAEYAHLPEDLRWRHMRYEPGTIDFTWEREWRIQCDSLPFAPHETGIVVPTREWAHRLEADHDSEQNYEVLQYSQIMDELLAEQYPSVPMMDRTPELLNLEYR